LPKNWEKKRPYKILGCDSEGLTVEKMSEDKCLDVIAKMKLWELFDNDFFVGNLQKLKSVNEKYEFIDNMLYLRGENKVFQFEFSFKRLEPLLRRFVRNLRLAVNRKKEAKKEIVSYFLLTEKGRPHAHGKNFDCSAKNLKKINPVGAPKPDLKSELEAAKRIESQLKKSIRDSRQTQKSRDPNSNDDQSEPIQRNQNFDEYNFSSRSVDIQNTRPSGSIPGYLTYHTTMSPNRQSTDDARQFRAKPDLDVSSSETPKIEQRRNLQVLQEESDSQGHSSPGNDLEKTEN
jgi:hypothetical protein